MFSFVWNVILVLQVIKLINYYFLIRSIKNSFGFLLILFLLCIPTHKSFAEDLNSLYSDIYSKATDAEDFYLTIYESTKDSQQNVLRRLELQTSFTQTEISQALQGNYTEGFKEACFARFGSETSDVLYRCHGILEDNFKYEQHLIDLEGRLANEALASEVWSDGDLSNSFFDIMTDFNIVEIILFGENTYTYPFDGDGSDSSDSGASGEGSDDTTGGTGEGGTGNDNTDGTSTNGNTEETSKDDTSGSEGDDSPEEDSSAADLSCRDPDEIVIDKLPPFISTPGSESTSTNTSETSNGSDTSETSDGSDTSETSAPISENPYQGGSFESPGSSSGCSGGTSLFKGLLCVDPWPCDSFFCIKVSTVPQTPAGGSATATYVEEIVLVGIGQLTYLKGHSLTVKKNSNERFMISVGKFLSHPISLDVVTQGIPVKLALEKTKFDDDEGDDGKSLSKSAKLRVEIGEKTGGFTFENGDRQTKEAKRTINDAEYGDLSSDTWSQVNKNTAAQNNKEEAIKKAWLQSQRDKHAQSNWEEIKKQLNAMANYFKSYEEAYVKMELDGVKIIEDDTGESCNSKS